MILDTSAVVAIVNREQERSSFLAAIDRATATRIAAPAVVELTIVLERWRSATARGYAQQVLTTLGATIEPFTPDLARIASEAHAVYGRGSGHPARLNFGDCLTYALAKATGEPLLFKGDDFGHTDLLPAIR